MRKIDMTKFGQVSAHAMHNGAHWIVNSGNNWICTLYDEKSSKYLVIIEHYVGYTKLYRCNTIARARDLVLEYLLTGKVK